MAWILAQGVWNDEGTWDDNAFWIDSYSDIEFELNEADSQITLLNNEDSIITILDNKNSPI